MRAAPTITVNNPTYTNASGMSASAGGTANSYTTWANPTATGTAAYGGDLGASADL
jgi:hypothetical protein